MYKFGHLDNGQTQDVSQCNRNAFVGHNMNSTPCSLSTPSSEGTTKSTTTSVLRRWRRPDVHDSTKNVPPKEAPSNVSTAPTEKQMNYVSGGETSAPNTGSDYPMYVPQLSPLVPQSTARPYDNSKYLVQYSENGVYSRNNSAVPPQTKEKTNTISQNPYYQQDGTTNQELHFRSSSYPVQNTPPMAHSSSQKCTLPNENINYPSQKAGRDYINPHQDFSTHNYPPQKMNSIESKEDPSYCLPKPGYVQDSRISPQNIPYPVQNTLDRRMSPHNPKSPVYRNPQQNYVPTISQNVNYFMDKTQKPNYPPDQSVIDARYLQNYNQNYYKPPGVTTHDPKSGRDYRNVGNTKKSSPPFPILEQRLNQNESNYPDFSVQGYYPPKFGSMMYSRTSPTSKIVREVPAGNLHYNQKIPSQETMIPPTYPFPNKYYQQSQGQEWKMSKDYEQNLYLTQMNQMHARLIQGKNPDIPRDLSYIDPTQRLSQKGRISYPEPNPAEHMQYSGKNVLPVAQKSPKMYNPHESMSNDYSNLPRPCGSVVKPTDYQRSSKIGEYSPVIQSLKSAGMGYDPKAPREYLMHQQTSEQQNYACSPPLVGQNIRNIPPYSVGYPRQTKVDEVPPRNISPRRTFQENMPVVVFSPHHIGLPKASPTPMYPPEYPNPQHYPGYYPREPVYPEGVKPGMPQYPMDHSAKYPNIHINRNIPQQRYFGYPEHQAYPHIHPDSAEKNYYAGNMYRSHYSPEHLQQTIPRSFENNFRTAEASNYGYEASRLDERLEYSKKDADLGKSLKEFLESWEDDEEIVANLPDLVLCNNIPSDKQKLAFSGSPVDANVISKPSCVEETLKDPQSSSDTEQPLYILGSTDISSEVLPQYLAVYEQVDKLPDNIKGFYGNSNQNGNKSQPNLESSEKSPDHMKVPSEASVTESSSPRDLTVNKNLVEERDEEVLNLSTNRTKENKEFLVEEYSNDSELDKSIPENQEAQSESTVEQIGLTCKQSAEVLERVTEDSDRIIEENSIQDPVDIEDSKKCNNGKIAETKETDGDSSDSKSNRESSSEDCALESPHLVDERSSTDNFQKEDQILSNEVAPEMSLATSVIVPNKYFDNNASSNRSSIPEKILEFSQSTTSRNISNTTDSVESCEETPCFVEEVIRREKSKVEEDSSASIEEANVDNEDRNLSLDVLDFDTSALMTTDAETEEIVQKLPKSRIEEYHGELEPMSFEHLINSPENIEMTVDECLENDLENDDENFDRNLVDVDSNSDANNELSKPTSEDNSLSLLENQIIVGREVSVMENGTEKEDCTVTANTDESSVIQIRSTIDNSGKLTEDFRNPTDISAEDDNIRIDDKPSEQNLAENIAVPVTTEKIEEAHIKKQTIVVEKTDENSSVLESISPMPDYILEEDFLQIESSHTEHVASEDMEEIVPLTEPVETLTPETECLEDTIASTIQEPVENVLPSTDPSEIVSSKLEDPNVNDTIDEREAIIESSAEDIAKVNTSRTEDCNEVVIEDTEETIASTTRLEESVSTGSTVIEDITTVEQAVTEKLTTEDLEKMVETTDLVADKNNDKFEKNISISNAEITKQMSSETEEADDISNVKEIAEPDTNYESTVDKLIISNIETTQDSCESKNTEEGNSTENNDEDLLNSDTGIKQEDITENDIPEVECSGNPEVDDDEYSHLIKIENLDDSVKDELISNASTDSLIDPETFDKKPSLNNNESSTHSFKNQNNKFDFSYLESCPDNICEKSVSEVEKSNQENNDLSSKNLKSILESSESDSDIPRENCTKLIRDKIGANGKQNESEIKTTLNNRNESSNESFESTIQKAVPVTEDETVEPKCTADPKDQDVIKTDENEDIAKYKSGIQFEEIENKENVPKSTKAERRIGKQKNNSAFSVSEKITKRKENKTILEVAEETEIEKISLRDESKEVGKDTTTFMRSNDEETVSELNVFETYKEKDKAMPVCNKAEENGAESRGKNNEETETAKENALDKKEIESEKEITSEENVLIAEQIPPYSVNEKDFVIIESVRQPSSVQILPEEVVTEKIQTETCTFETDVPIIDFANKTEEEVTGLKSISQSSKSTENTFVENEPVDLDQSSLIFSATGSSEEGLLLPDSQCVIYYDGSEEYLIIQPDSETTDIITQELASTESEILITNESEEIALEIEQQKCDPVEETTIGEVLGEEIIICEESIEDWVQNEEIINNGEEEEIAETKLEEKIDEIQQQPDESLRTLRKIKYIRHKNFIPQQTSKPKGHVSSKKKKFLIEKRKEKLDRLKKQKSKEIREIAEKFITEEKRNSLPESELEDDVEEKELFINPENPISYSGLPETNSIGKRRMSCNEISSPKIDFKAPKRRYSTVEIGRSVTKPIINLDEISKNITEVLENLNKQKELLYNNAKKEKSRMIIKKEKCLAKNTDESKNKEDKFNLQLEGKQMPDDKLDLKAGNMANGTENIMPVLEKSNNSTVEGSIMNSFSDDIPELVQQLISPKLIIPKTDYNIVANCMSENIQTRPLLIKPLRRSSLLKTAKFEQEDSSSALQNKGNTGQSSTKLQRRPSVLKTSGLEQGNISSTMENKPNNEQSPRVLKTSELKQEETSSTLENKRSTEKSLIKLQRRPSVLKTFELEQEESSSILENKPSPEQLLPKPERRPSLLKICEFKQEESLSFSENKQCTEKSPIKLKRRPSLSKSVDEKEETSSSVNTRFTEPVSFRSPVLETNSPPKRQNVDPRLDRPKDLPEKDEKLLTIDNKLSNTFGLTEYTKNYIKMKTGQSMDFKNICEMRVGETKSVEENKNNTINNFKSKHQTGSHQNQKSSDKKIKINLQDYRNRKLSQSDSNFSSSENSISSISSPKNDDATKFEETYIPKSQEINRKTGNTIVTKLKHFKEDIPVRKVEKPKKTSEEVTKGLLPISIVAKVTTNCEELKEINSTNKLDCNNLESVDNVNSKSKIDLKHRPKKRKRRFRNLDAVDEEDEVPTKQPKNSLDTARRITPNEDSKIVEEDKQNAENSSNILRTKESGTKEELVCCLDLNSNGTVDKNSYKCRITLDANSEKILDYEINKDSSDHPNKLKLTLKSVQKKKPAFSEVLSNLDSLVEGKILSKRQRRKLNGNKHSDRNGDGAFWTVKSKIPKVIIKRNGSGYRAVFRDVGSNPIWQPKIRLKRQKYIESLMLTTN